MNINKANHYKHTIHLWSACPERSRGIVCCLLSVVLTMSGCASLTTYNPATGRREFIAISTSSEVSMGSQVHESIIKKYKLSKNIFDINRIKKIGNKIAQVSDRKDYEYKFYVVEDEELNAFTTPGGNVYIHSQLIKKLKTDDQIAFVLAHEIGHCAARHVVKKYQAALGYNLIGNLLLNQLEPGSGAQKVASLSSGTIINIVFSSYSRKDEYQADLLGLKYLYLSGYKPQGAVKALEALQEESRGGKGLLLFRSHPYLEDRIKTVQQEIAGLDEKYSNSNGAK